MKRITHILLALLVFATTVAYAQSGNFFIHTVKKGDTLYSLSHTYEVSIDEIVKMNPGSDKKLSLGQKLKIPQKKQVQMSGKKDGAIYHTIQSGETLYRLGKKYNITIQAICDANPGLSYNNFKAGEVILIPVGDKVTAQDNTPRENEQPAKEEKKYTVKKGDTIDGICKKFGITKKQLLEANPELKSKKLKRKMVLVIPEPKKETAPQKEQSNIEAFSRYEQYKDSIKQEIQNLEEDNDNTTRVGIVLSFLLNSYAPSEQSRIIEYYQGFLVAVNRLKSEGYSFEINTFDAGPKEESLDSLLATGELDRMDLIIGATYANHNKELADFAKEKEIPLVIPFTSKEKSLYRNPMVYIVNSNQSYVIPDVTEQFVKKFPTANVIFVEDTIKDDKKDFVAELTETLDRHKIPHTTIAMSNFHETENAINTLRELQAAGRENIIIPTSSSSKTLNTLLPALVQSKQIDSTCVAQYKLFGYPEWQIYVNDTNGKMYEVNTYFYAPFYSHHTLPQVNQFHNDFAQWYSCNIQNIYPRYALLGYDTGYYFLLAVAKYGKDLAENINEIRYLPLQRGFKFERVNNWGGMVNKKFYFIHFTPEYNIERIDFDR